MQRGQLAWILGWGAQEGQGAANWHVDPAAITYMVRDWSEQ